MNTVYSMAGHPEWIAASAVWSAPAMGRRHAAFRPRAPSKPVIALTVPGGGQAALIGLVDGQPAGSVFLVGRDARYPAHT